MQIKADFFPLLSNVHLIYFNNFRFIKKARSKSAISNWINSTQVGPSTPPTRFTLCYSRWPHYQVWQRCRRWPEDQSWSPSLWIVPGPEQCNTERIQTTCMGFIQAQCKHRYEDVKKKIIKNIDFFILPFHNPRHKPQDSSHLRDI